MDEALLKNTIAKNISRFRKQANMTQLELAEKLNYSDKAVSKWERAEAVPDVYVLKNMAQLFRVHVDDFFDETGKKIYISFSIEKRIIISLMSCLSIFLAAVIFFACFIMFEVSVSAWLCFIFAVPASALSFLIFSITWRKNLLMTIFGSILTWTLALALFLSLSSVLSNGFVIFLIAIPVQVIIILCFVLGIVNKRRKKRLMNS